jgi:hypothetical protein
MKTAPRAVPRGDKELDTVTRERNNLRDKVKQLESAAQRHGTEVQQLNTQLAEVRSAHESETQNVNLQLENARRDADALRGQVDELTRDRAANDAVVAELRAQIAQLQQQLQQQQQQTHPLFHPPHKIPTPSPSLSSSYRPMSNSSNLPASFVGAHPFPGSPSPHASGYIPSPSLRSSSPLHPSSVHGASPLTSHFHAPYTPSPPTPSTVTATPPTPHTSSQPSPFNVRPTPSNASPAPPPSAGPTPFTSPSHNVLRTSAFTSTLSNSTSDFMAPKSTTDLQVNFLPILPPSLPPFFHIYNFL